MASGAFTRWSTSGTTPYIGSTNSYGFGIVTNNLHRLFVRANGNVGIGTLTADYKLEVVDNANNDFVMHIENTANSNTSKDHGLSITAGHNSYSSFDNSSKFIQFKIPNGIEIGSIRQIGNSVFYYENSDKRLKDNIRPTRFGLENLLKIEVRDYTYKTDPSHVQTGFIAQQLYTAYSPAVSVGGDNPATNPWQVAYGSLTPLLAQAVQDQQEIIEAQQAKIESQQTKVESLKAKADEVDVLKAEIDNIKSVLGIDSEMAKNK